MTDKSGLKPPISYKSAKRWGPIGLTDEEQKLKGEERSNWKDQGDPDAIGRNLIYNQSTDKASPSSQMKK